MSKQEKDAMSVEDMLRSGMDPRMMINDLQDEIKLAQEKIAKEKAAAACKRDLDAYRKTLAKALVEYIKSFDFVDTSDIPEDIEDEVVDLLKQLEVELEKLWKILEIMYGDDIFEALTKKDNKEDAMDKQLSKLLKEIMK